MGGLWLRGRCDCQYSLQEILGDPAMQMILQQMQKDPAAAKE